MDLNKSYDLGMPTQTPNYYNKCVCQNSGNIGYGHNIIINYYFIVTNDFKILLSQTKALISAKFEMIGMYCGGNRILYWYSN